VTRDNSGGGFAMKKRAGVLFLQHFIFAVQQKQCQSRRNAGS